MRARVDGRCIVAPQRGRPPIAPDFDGLSADVVAGAPVDGMASRVGDDCGCIRGHITSSESEGRSERSDRSDNRNNIDCLGAGATDDPGNNTDDEDDDVDGDGSDEANDDGEEERGKGKDVDGGNEVSDDDEND